MLFLSLRDWLERNSRALLRLFAVFAIVIASAVQALRPTPLLIGLIFGAGAALVLLRWPVVGLAGIVIGGLVVPLGIGTGSDSEINPPLLLIAVLLGIWLLGVPHRRTIRLTPSRTILPLIGLVFVAALSLIIGQLPWFYSNPAPIRAQIGGLGIFVLSAGAYLLMGYYVKKLRSLEWLTWIFIALGTAYMAGLYLPPVGEITSRLFLPDAAGSLFWTWLVAMAFSQAVFNRQLHPISRIALGGLVLATLYYGMVINLGWTSGWAPPVLAIGVILLVGLPRLGIPLILAGGMAALLSPQTITAMFDVGDNAYSAMTRVEAWNILLQIIHVSPFLGVGPANYYFYTPLFPILGYHVRFNSHNNYIDIVAQTGLLGLACFLWFGLEVGLLGWRLRHRVPPGFAQAYVYGALGGLAAMLFAGMLGDWVLPFVYNVGFAGFRASVLGWIFLGGLLALEQMTLGQAARQAEANTTTNTNLHLVARP